MADTPRLTQAKKTERAAREARLAEALRDNLHRRKQQMRARAAPRAAQGGDPGDAKDDVQGGSAAPSDRRTGNPGATG